MNMGNCVVCKESFVKSHPRRIYCSNACNQKVYYLKNREKYILAANVWAINNPEKKKLSSKKSVKKFLETKRDRFNALMRKHYAENADKINARNKARREQKKLEGDNV